MPVPINTAEQVQALIDAFVVKGGYRLSLDEVVVPVALVADLAPSEYPAAMAGNYRTPVNRMTFSLYNPTGSAVDLLLDMARINIWATSQVRTGSFGAILANTEASTFRDLRNGNPTTGQFRWEDLAAAPAGGNPYEALRLNGGNMEQFAYDSPIVIGPGQQYWYQCETNAATFGLGLLWRERPR